MVLMIINSCHGAFYPSSKVILVLRLQKSFGTLKFRLHNFDNPKLRLRAFKNIKLRLRLRKSAEASALLRLRNFRLHAHIWSLECIGHFAIQGRSI